MSDLRGVKVLVVEDEGGIALLIEDMLMELGCDVYNSVAHLGKALEIAGAAVFDLAILDVNLDGQPVFPVARALRGRNIPFIFSTGYGATGLPEEFCDAPVVGKPFDLNSLRDAISVGLMNHRGPKTFTR